MITDNFFILLCKENVGGKIPVCPNSQSNPNIYGSDIGPLMKEHLSHGDLEFIEGQLL